MVLLIIVTAKVSFGFLDFSLFRWCAFLLMLLAAVCISFLWHLTTNLLSSDQVFIGLYLPKRPYIEKKLSIMTRSMFGTRLGSFSNLISKSFICVWATATESRYLIYYIFCYLRYILSPIYVRFNNFVILLIIVILVYCTVIYKNIEEIAEKTRGGDKKEKNI